jgi:hypothetical protein
MTPSTRPGVIKIVDWFGVTENVSCRISSSANLIYLQLDLEKQF